MHILSIRYLKKRSFCFNKITENNEEKNEDSEEVETISNLEKEIKKSILGKEKKDARALLLAAPRPSISAIFVPRLSAPLSTSASALFMFIPASVFLSLSIFAMFMLLLGSAALLFVSSVSMFLPEL